MDDSITVAPRGTAPQEGPWPGVARPARLLEEIATWLAGYGSPATRRTYAEALGLPTGAEDLRVWLDRAREGDPASEEAWGWARSLGRYADVMDLTGLLRPDHHDPAGTSRSGPPRRVGRLRTLHWLRWCAATGRDPLTATAREVLAWQDALRKARAAAATRAKMLAAVAALYRHLTAAGLVAANPADVDRDRLGLDAAATASSPVVLTPAQVAALYTAAGRRRRGASAIDAARAQAVVALFTLGLRVSELCGLDRADLHTTRGRRALRVRGKGDKTRVVYLSALAEAALSAYLAARDDTRPGTGALAPSAGAPPLAVGEAGPPAREPLLVGRTGARCDRRDLWSLLRRLARAAGPELADIADALHPHALRHFYITTGVEAGVDLAHIQADVGHASIDTTRRVYDHSAPDPTRSAVDPVAAALAPHLAPASEPEDASPAGAGGEVIDLAARRARRG